MRKLNLGPRQCILNVKMNKRGISVHKVLLILDSDDLSMILHKELSENFEVKVSDVATSVDMIDHYRPDALILDLFLPGTDGFQVLQHTHHNSPSIILLTVLVSSDIQHRAAELEVNYIFLKPFKLSALTKRLYELLSIDVD